MTESSAAVTKTALSEEVRETVNASPDSAAGGLRERVLAAALLMLDQEGRDSLTTRSVAAAAGVQAPALYRLFGDKRGLLNAVVEHGYAAYLREKGHRTPAADPLDELRAGWDLHVSFGLAHPAMYTLMVAGAYPGETSSAEASGRVYLERKVRALALAGRLRVSEEQAAQLMHASASGVVLTLLSLPQEKRDPGLSLLARESVMAAISTDAPAARTGKASSGFASAAVTLRARLPEVSVLTPGERLLLDELLSRLTS